MSATVDELRYVKNITAKLVACWLIPSISALYTRL